MTGDPQSITIGGASYLTGYDDGRPEPSLLFQPTPERIAELTAMAYQEYLQTPEWREKRRLAIARSEHRCNRCHRHGIALHAHHKTYERLGNEHPDDLEALCQACHSEHHRRLLAS